MTAKQVIAYLFGPADQAKAQRKLPIGALTIARNVRQLKDGEPRKRPGFTKLAPSFTGASWTTAVLPTGVAAGPNGTLFTVDGDDRAWAYDPDAVTWRSRGRLKRIMPTEQVVMPSGSTPVQPVVVEAGTQLWTFTVDVGAVGIGGAATAYHYTVVDTTTGQEILAPTKVSATFFQLCAVYNGSNVWVFLASGGTTVASHKFSTASPGTAPTTATYQTIGGSILDNIRAAYLSAAAEVFVVVAGHNPATNTYWYSHSLLNTSNGQAKGAPAAVTVTATIANTLQIAVPGILKHDGANGHAYYAIWYYGTVVNQAELRLVDVTLSTLAAANTSLATPSGTGGNAAFGVSCGMRDSGNSVVFAEFDNGSGTAPSTRPDQHSITKYLYNGSVVTPTTGPLGYWIASDPALVGSEWYFMVGHDDSLGPGGTTLKVNSVQQTYFLLNGSMQLVSQALRGQASRIWHLRDVFPFSAGNNCGCFVPPLTLSGGKLIAGVGIHSGSVIDQSVGIIRWETAPTLGKIVSAQAKAVSPGGIPTTWGHATQFRELAPLMSPGFVTASASGSNKSVAVVYRFIDSDGTITRSAPLEGTLSIGAATMTVPTLRQLLPGTTAQIEFYAADLGAGPFLQKVLDNDPTVNTLSFTYPGTTLTDETLYTKVQGLVNEPPPPARVVAWWRSQLYLSGTEETGDIWRSHEAAVGFGLTFDSANNLLWDEGTGDITGMQPVDWSLLAVFRRDSVGVLRSGGTVVQSLSTPMGVARTDSLATGPSGCYFQAAADNQIYLVTPGMQVVYVSQGADSIGNAQIFAAAADPANRHMRFYDFNGVVWVLDYGFPTPEQPVGQWYQWEDVTGALPVAIGADVDTTGILRHVQTDGDIRQMGAGVWTDATNHPVLVKVQTGKLPVFGPQQQGRISDVNLLGQQKGACDLRLTIASGSLSSNHDKTLSGSGDLQLTARPPSLLHVQEVQLTIEETANGGGTEGFIPESVAMVVQPRGRARYPEASEVF